MKPEFVMAAKWVATRVSEQLPYGPANAPGKWENRRIIQSGAVERTGKVQDGLIEGMGSLGITDRKSLYEKMDGYLNLQANLGLLHRAGNCDAMGAIAYRYFKSSPTYRPLVIHSFQKSDKSDGHVFVTLDQAVKGAEMKDWDADTVVICDPWLAHMHALLPNIFSSSCTSDELMGAYTVVRHMKFMNDLGYAGGSEVELSRLDG